MATATVTEFITRTVNATAATGTSSSRATPQGGVFEGLNPTHYDPKNPITLFIIQASIVIILTRIIHVPLAYLRQPRVIAEVITGIILGPSVMGRIPGFTNAIFPTISMPAFTLAANLGLVLFLFLVGLEVDLRFLASNWRIAVSVSALGMVIPFGLGCGIAWGLYRDFRSDAGLAPISFGVYMLFIGVAMAITAFPVLCRILTTLKLLSTPVGVIVLSAGVGNDVVGWILLALCVALVNSGAGLTALWILLVAVGYTLFLVFAVRPVVMWFLRKTGSLANGPTQTVVALTILLVLASAFFTGIIGIHPIFGAFIIGLMLPHEGGFAIKLTEKIEDLVGVLFLPLYFALSGLSTNLGLLNNGLTWGYVVGVCVIAFVGKITGGTLAARLNGLVWRESFTIGVLMSCKGLVELIVLNIGLQAKILSTRTFTIFVVMALITTFATTPLTTWLYPAWYQRKLELWKQGKIDWDGNPLHHDNDTESTSEADILRKTNVAKKVLVYLRLDGLPSLFTMVSLFAHKVEETIEPQNQTENDGPLMKNPQALSSVIRLRRPLQVHGLRLMELTERESSVMRVAEIEEFAGRDPVIKAFGTFGQSCDMAVGGQIAVVPDHSFSGTLLSRARDLKSDLVLVPWSETGTMSEYPSLFDAKPGDPLANKPFATFTVEIFEKARASCHVGVMIDKTLLCTPSGASKIDSPVSERPTRQLNRTLTGVSLVDQTNSTVHFKLAESGRTRLFVLYQGDSEDDLFAVQLGLQLAKNRKVDLKILNARAGRNDGDAVGQAEDTDHDNKMTALSKVHTLRTPTDFEFDAIRASIPDCGFDDRVTVVDVHLSGLEAVVAAISEPSLAETLVILGRSTFHSNATNTVAGASTGESSMSSSVVLTGVAGPSVAREENRALGPLATQLVKTVRDRQLRTGLLVVQARRENAAEVPDAFGGFGAPPNPVDMRDLKGMALAKKMSALSDDD